MGKKTRFALVLFLFFGVFGSVAAILWRFSPTEINAPPCAFHELFGLYCPGCGSTRALRRILRGDLIGAFRYNPALILLSPVLLWGTACFFYDRWRGCFPYRKGSLTFVSRWFSSLSSRAIFPSNVAIGYARRRAHVHDDASIFCFDAALLFRKGRI